jgi:suppressor of ftsI
MKYARLILIPLLFLAGCGKKTITTQLPAADEQTVHMCLMGWGKNCDIILNPANKATYGNEIQKVCTMMPMDICKTYFASNAKSTDISALPEVQKTQIVTLRSWDTYDMRITAVKMQLKGKWIRMLAYNGMIPGPTLQAPQGATVTLKVTNDVPDLITTLHSHGLRLDNLFDGVPKSMMWTQDPMQYKDSFAYTLKFPDAGLFRYHPHMDEQIQQELGLYGNYMVTPNNDSTRANNISQQEVIILDDMQLTSDGTPQVSSNPDNQMLMGRYGNTMLINGQETFGFATKRGDVTRLYLTNTANVRPFNITIPGAKMKLIGSDIGMYERPQMVENILIAPAERYIVDVYFEKAWSYTITDATPTHTTSLGTITVTDTPTPLMGADTFSTLLSHQQVQNDIAAYRKYFEKPIDKNITIDMTMQMNHGGMMWGGMMMGWTTTAGTPITMAWLTYDANTIERDDTMAMMNNMSDKKNTTRKLIDDDTKKENMDIMWMFTKGDVIKVHITNKKTSQHPMQHPIHFHGQRFLVLTHNGERNTNLAWKDTVLLWAGDSVDFLIDMSNPGTWMAHCHIAEHLMDGMMLHYVVR